MSPIDILPFQKAGLRRRRTLNRRKGSTRILTDTPVREKIAAVRSARAKKKAKPGCFPTKRNLFEKPRELASLLVVFLGKASNGMPPLSCGRQVVGPGSRAANLVDFCIKFKFEFEFEFSLFYEFEFKFEFDIFIFASLSSSSSPVKIYQVLSSLKNKVSDLALARLQ